LLWRKENLDKIKFGHPIIFYGVEKYKCQNAGLPEKS
jgi:hypothetical protein